jgi:hypothetical protein
MFFIRSHTENKTIVHGVGYPSYHVTFWREKTPILHYIVRLKTKNQKP